MNGLNLVRLMTSVKEALRKRKFSPELIDKIIDNGLNITRIQRMNFDAVRKVFDEIETVQIWEQISIPFREANRDIQAYRQLKKFCQEDGYSLDHRREVFVAFDKCLEMLTSLKRGDNRILFFIGNGINEVRRYNPKTKKVILEDNSLSTRHMALNYVNDMSDSKPREFQEKKDTLKKIHSVLSQDHDEYDMLSFMKHFSDMWSIKEGFLEHVVETCAQADPNSNHNVLLLLILLLLIMNDRCHLVIFTTNYDNLLEKAFLDYERRFGFEKRRDFNLPPPFFSNEKEKRSKTIRAMTKIEEKLPQLRPKYVMSASKLEEHLIPIVPIHGSIRACRCESCPRELETEATAIGRKRCVYCGSELSTVVLPTAEGETDKRLLRILEDEIGHADVIFFIGYGMDDPHIRQKVNSGLEGQKGKTIVNVCGKRIDTDRIRTSGHELIEINYYIDRAFERVALELIDHLGLLRDGFSSLLSSEFRRRRIRYRRYGW